MELQNYETVYTAAIQKTLDVQPEEPSESELINMSCPRESNTGKNIYIKRTLEDISQY